MLVYDTYNFILNLNTGETQNNTYPINTRFICLNDKTYYYKKEQAENQSTQQLTIYPADPQKDKSNIQIPAVYHPTYTRIINNHIYTIKENNTFAAFDLNSLQEKNIAENIPYETQLKTIESNNYLYLFSSNSTSQQVTKVSKQDQSVIYQVDTPLNFSQINKHPINQDSIDETNDILYLAYQDSNHNVFLEAKSITGRSKSRIIQFSEQAPIDLSFVFEDRYPVHIQGDTVIVITDFDYIYGVPKSAI